MKLIDKDALIAEINMHLEYANTGVLYAQSGIEKGLKEYECDLNAWQHCQSMCKNILSFLDTLEEVKDMNFETDIERRYVKCHIDIFDKKFPIMPTLEGQYLHDYKNFLNTCQQIFGLKWWGMHPTQAILFEKLTLLWATWGAYHLKGLFEMSPEERQKMDDIKGE